MVRKGQYLVNSHSSYAKYHQKLVLASLEQKMKTDLGVDIECLAKTLPLWYENVSN